MRTYMQLIQPMSFPELWRT